MLNLDEIKKRAEAAAQGRWIAAVEDGREYAPAFRIYCESDPDGSVIDDQASAEFAAHAREDIPALVAEVERLRAEVVRLEEMVARHRCSVGGPP